MTSDPDHYQLPAAYRFLEHSIRLIIPGFERFDQEVLTLTLSPTPIPTVEHFSKFEEQIETAIASRTWLPVCRLGDGEYRLLLGDVAPSLRLSRIARTRARVRGTLGRLRRRNIFVAATRPGVSSGRYTSKEIEQLRDHYTQQLKRVADNGILALRLNYSVKPSVEQYFPHLGYWLHNNQITLSDSNYVPVYFVYALLAGPRFRESIRGRRIGLLHSAQGEKRRAITEHFHALGVEGVAWFELSEARSAFDTVDMQAIRDSGAEILLLGAGLGKPLLFAQLEEFAGPCIDAGFMFEVWAEPLLALERPFCVPDAEVEDLIRRSGQGS